MSLSNNTVRGRIDDMGGDVEKQLIEKLRTRKFSLQMDESTIRDSESLLLAYVRFIDDENLQEEMLFCESLETTTTAKDIYKTLKSYLERNNIPFCNIVSCTADGAPAMMGNQTGCLKLMKDENPSMLIIHCVIHRENLAAKSRSTTLHDVMNRVIKCINYIKARPKCKRLFRKFCQDSSADHVRLLFHTEVRWLSKGNSLQRFMELFDELKEFLGEDQNMRELSTLDEKAFVSYLADIFGKLNSLNTRLQGRKVTLLDAKTKIFGFIKSLELCKTNVGAKNFGQFDWLKKSKVSDNAVKVISEHLDALINDFSRRFSDLKDFVIPSWLGQPFLVDVAEVEVDLQDELAELQCDQSMETMFESKGVLGWLNESIRSSYLKTSCRAADVLIHFPSSYLVECGFSVVNNLVSDKRNRLEITKRGDLRLKLTHLMPRIKALCTKR